MPDWRFLFDAPATPRASAASAGWETGLDPTLKGKARQLIALAAQEGIELRVTSGYRAPAEQARLYAQGRSAPGKVVTNAPPGRSRHQHGEALDVVPLTDGQPDWNSPHWARLGELGKSVGLRWGGDFQRLTDRPHFELPKAEAAARHAAGPRPRPAPRDWQQTLFGAHAPTRRAATPPDRAGLVQQIRQEAQRRGVDPDLAVAVATQESSLNASAVGDNGNSLGVFQLQRAAALDAGIDPDRRGEVAENIRGGVGYLKLQLDREGGNVERALSRYNRGTPTYLGRGDPRYVEHVLQYYRPGARTTPQPAAPREWGQELFGTVSAPQSESIVSSGTVETGGPIARRHTDWRAEREAPPTATGQPAPRDWGQALGLAPGAERTASAAPAGAPRAWGQELFG